MSRFFLLGSIFSNRVFPILLKIFVGKGGVWESVSEGEERGGEGWADVGLGKSDNFDWGSGIGEGE
jgi:hypothetical protein